MSQAALKQLNSVQIQKSTRVQNGLGREHWLFEILPDWKFNGWVV
ncbi:hypothetical protein [Leptolyngbya sp. FACHB-36]|nr:hypothetical protein [Leptolyngbya sp. FACHB-36]